MCHKIPPIFNSLRKLFHTLPQYFLGSVSKTKPYFTISRMDYFKILLPISRENGDMGVHNLFYFLGCNIFILVLDCAYHTSSLHLILMVMETKINTYYCRLKEFACTKYFISQTILLKNTILSMVDNFAMAIV